MTMPDIRPDFRFVLSLSKADIRLIGLALIGKLDNPKDRAAAAELNRDILAQITQLHKDALKVNEGALETATTILDKIRSEGQ